MAEEGDELFDLCAPILHLILYIIVITFKMKPYNTNKTIFAKKKLISILRAYSVGGVAIYYFVRI